MRSVLAGFIRFVGPDVYQTDAQLVARLQTSSTGSVTRPGKLRFGQRSKNTI